MSDSDDDSRVLQPNGERKVIVAVRVRPKKNHGTERYDSTCLHIDHGFDFGASCLLSPTRGSDVSERPASFSGASAKSTAQQPTVMISDPEGKVDPLTFAFDRVFDDTDDQDTVYQEIVHGPVLSALDSGGDALFVAYGQTGSGKTYTMLGEQARYASSNTPVTPPLSLASSHRGLRLDQTLGSPGKVMAGTTYLGGDDHSPTDVEAGAGVLMRVMSNVLQYKEVREGPDKQWHVVVAMSAVEVYNDSLFDLLAANGGARAHIKTGPNARNVELDVREFGDDLFITNLQRFVITNTSHVQMVFEIALKNRSVAPTHMNDTSSRSHAIFTTEVFLQRRTASNPDPPDPGLMAEHLISSTYINSRTKRNNAATSATGTPALSPEGNPSNDFISFPFTASRITMVDLAGNERVKKSGVSGKELNEAVAVNKSLSALGHVVHQICQGSRHISFRDSKVTRLLRSSFSNPKSKIVFITNVSPIGLSYPESVCSLRFAARLKELKPVVCTAASQPNVAVKEDQILQRLHIFEQLCADFRILRDGHDYRPQVSRWRKSTGNTRLSAKGAAIRYGDEVRELQETRRVLELEHYVQEFASSIRLSSSQANVSTGGATAEAKGNERQIALRAELERLDKTIVEERAAVERSKSDLAKLQEEMNAANRLLGVKSDAQRAIAALVKEADELDALIIAAKDPTKSEYGQALDGLNNEKATMARDAEINAANAQFATRLLEHNNSKIAVRAERIEQLGLRNTIDSIQQRIMSLYSNRTMQRVRVPVSALAASDTTDMRKVLEMCSVRQQQVSAPLRDDQLIDGPQALEQVMARRLKEATSLSFGNVSPIAFYVSPQTSVQLGKYLKGLGESAAHVRSGSTASHSVSNFDSDDEQTTTSTQKVQCISEPPLALFETIAEKKRHILKEALSLIVTHGRVLEILDEVHASRYVDSATLQKLFVALDDVPIDGNAFGAIISCAKRQGDDGGSSSDWSGDELESNLDSPTSMVRQEGKPTNQRLVAAEQTRRVLKRILEGSAKLSSSNIALIRCVQAYALFNRVDDLCEAAQDPQKLTVNRVIAEIRRRAMLRRILDVQSSPLSSGSTEERRVRSSDILPTDSLDTFVKSCYASMGRSTSNEEIDWYLSYLSPHAGAMSSQVLCPAALLGHRAPLVAAPRRDVSPIAFYGSRIIDSANLMASPTVAEVSEAIPYMPSSVRFTEMMLMCCGYRR